MKSLQLIKSRFNTRDLILLGVIAICLVIIISGFILFFIPTFSDHGLFLMNAAQNVAGWIGLILLLLNGTLMKTKYWNYIKAGALIVLMSAVFKILHLPGANALLFAGLVLIEVVYTIRFIFLKDATAFDWMKYTWIGAWYSATIFIVFGNWSEKWWLVADVLFWITLAMFLTRRLNHPSQQSEKVSFK
jgi:hypothetical protein